MEDNLTPRPSTSPRPVTRRPMDDFSATPTPRPMSIPVNSPPEDSKKEADSNPDTVSMSLSELNSKIADDIASESTEKENQKEESQNAPIPSEPELHTPETMPEEKSSGVESNEQPVPVPINLENEKPEEKKELIPGLNAKPADDAFKEAPVSIDDTSEEQTPNLDLNTPANKSNVGVVTSAQYDKSNKKGRSMAIIVAIVLALALIAGAGYAYLQNSKETTPPANTNTTVKPAIKETTPAEDIDSLNSQIDDSLKVVNDSTDYQQNDLTDTTLGL